MSNQSSRNRAVVFAALALAVAGGTAMLASTTISGYEQRLEAAKNSKLAKAVVVAAVDIRAGKVLEESDLALAERNVATFGDSVYRDKTLVVGELAAERILIGETIRKERLLSGGGHLHVDTMLRPGTRAVTVRASRESAVGGLLKPGFFVDVIVTIRPDTHELGADWVTETILQSVRILGVGDDVALTPTEDAEEARRGKEKRPPRETWVTLEVEPQEAEHLALASARGELHLSLRARDDYELLDPGKPLVTNALIGLPPPVVHAERRIREFRSSSNVVTAPKDNPSAAHVTDMIRGREVVMEQYDEAGMVLQTDVRRR